MSLTAFLTAMKNDALALARTEFLVETNEGTFSATEACRAIGTGDPTAAVRRVYSTVEGACRSTGPDEDRAPGRMRRLNQRDLAEARRRLAELRRQITQLRREVRSEQ